MAHTVQGLESLIYKGFAKTVFIPRINKFKKIFSFLLAKNNKI